MTREGDAASDCRNQASNGDAPNRRGRKSRLFLFLTVAIVFVVVSAWISIEYPWGTWRYRITVVVSTPEGVKTGSAVRELSQSTSFVRFPESTSPSSFSGEAVVVDLGPRGMLFVLTNGNARYDLIEAFPYRSGDGALAPEGIHFYNNLKPGSKAVLPRTQYPWLVAFDDINDPQSVRKIDPNALHEVFGEGVSLREIVLEITDDPVTWQVEKWLPWLPEYFDKKFDGHRYQTIEAESQVANALSAGAFTRRVKK